MPEHVYSDGKHKATVTGAVGMSNKAILVITKDYVEELPIQNSKVAIEASTLKLFKTPCVLLWFDDLTPEMKQEAKLLLKGLVVVKEFDNVPKNSFDSWMKNVFDKWLHTEGL